MGFKVITTFFVLFVGLQTYYCQKNQGLDPDEAIVRRFICLGCRPEYVDVENSEELRDCTKLIPNASFAAFTGCLPHTKYEYKDISHIRIPRNAVTTVFPIAFCKTQRDRNIGAFLFSTHGTAFDACVGPLKIIDKKPGGHGETVIYTACRNVDGILKVMDCMRKKLTGHEDLSWFPQFHVCFEKLAFKYSC